MLAKKRGRPATGRGKTIGVRIHDPDLECLDKWRDDQADAQLSRPEAIRQLVIDALVARGYLKPKDPKA